MPLSFKRCCPQRLSSSGCLCIKFSSSHVGSSVGKFFHLMRYSEIDRFRSCQVPVSVTAPGSQYDFSFLFNFWQYCLNWDLLQILNKWPYFFVFLPFIPCFIYPIWLDNRNSTKQFFHILILEESSHLVRSPFF